MKQLFSLIFLFSSLVLSAQTADKAFDKQIETFVKQYEMDTNQAVQYRQLMMDKKKELSRLEKTAKSYNEKLLEIQNKFDNSVLSILDDRQKKIFAIQKAMRENRPVSGRDNNSQLID